MSSAERELCVQIEGRLSEGQIVQRALRESTELRERIGRSRDKKGERKNTLVHHDEQWLTCP